MSRAREPGAPPEPGVIPLSVPNLGGNEWTYVKDCLDTSWVSSVGPYVDRFEREFAQRLGAASAVAVVNGTAALHTALLVVGVEPDDEVLVPTLTFIAPVNAIRYVGAWPIFIDAEPRYWQMDVDQAVRFLKEQCRLEDGQLRNRRSGRRVRAILPVHILGHPVEMSPLLEAARRYGLAVVEDATESLGGAYLGRPLGTLGDIGCFSFNGNKVITTGGGGMLVTNNLGFAEQARYLTTQAKDDPIEYVHHAIGYNYRLTNVQAALGVAQLEQLDGFLQTKRRIADFYREQLAEVPGITMFAEAPWATNAFWLSTIVVNGAAYGRSSRSLMAELDRAGVQARPFWRPAHRQRPYTACQAVEVSVADRLYRDGLELPSSTNITQAELDRVAGLVAASAVIDGAVETATTRL